MMIEKTKSRNNVKFFEYYYLFNNRIYKGKNDVVTIKWEVRMVEFCKYIQNDNIEERKERGSLRI